MDSEGKKPGSGSEFIPSGLLKIGLNLSVLVKNEKTIKFKFTLCCGTTNYCEKSHESHDAYSASRLNISMATSAVIDSWEINSAAL